MTGTQRRLCRRRRGRWWFLILLGSISSPNLATAAGREGGLPPLPPTMTEDEIIYELRRLKDEPSPQRFYRFQNILRHADTLLERFPESHFRNEALILKLTVFSGLARTDPGFLKKLEELTESIARDKPTGELAAENAYYAIDAFLLNARATQMPDDRRFDGLRERYENFLANHSDSRRAPVIAASLARNLLTQGKLETAKACVEELVRNHPDHPSARRAQGELRRARAVGQPFAIDIQMPDGTTMRTGDYKGKVVLVHFWAGRDDESTGALPTLKSLYDELAGRGLQLVGVSLDRDRKQAEQFVGQHQFSWPQFYDTRGWTGGVAVEYGVIQLPTYFVIDREGVLRSTDPGDKLPEMIKALVSGSAAAATPTEKTAPPPSP